MRVGVELAHHAPKVGIHGRFDGATKLGLRVEQMPELAGRGLEAGDPRLAALPTKRAAIGELAATAGIKRRLGESDLARSRIGDLGRQGQGFRVVVAIEMHAA